MWRGDCRPNISVAAPFVWRCLTGSTLAPSPHPAHRTGHADLPHPALGQDITPRSRATQSAVLEHSSELIGCPISRSLTTSCVRLELRSLPSTGVTLPERYYEPLLHLRAPGLSLAGVRLAIPDHALRLPVLRTLSLCTCCRHYPGAAAGRTLRSSRPPVSAFPEPTIGSARTSSFSRLARRSLTLRPAHSHGHQIRDRYPKASDISLRHLHACSGCFRLERLPGGPCTRWRSAALSRRTWIPDLGTRGERSEISTGGRLLLVHDSRKTHHLTSIVGRL